MNLQPRARGCPAMQAYFLSPPWQYHISSAPRAAGSAWPVSTAQRHRRKSITKGKRFSCRPDCVFGKA
jgi:hypothetical protein